MKFIWPLVGTVSSPFGDRAGGRHEGVDILAPPGTEVHAAEAGTTVYAGGGMRGYGNTVVLDHGDGVTTLYGHLRAVRVKSADVVPEGAVIGTVGRTGNATAFHLHFELRVDGEAVDPLAYLAR
jgi:murein DD-endopeptidase MepM/ murein hydrolase activator NlpD